MKTRILHKLLWLLLFVPTITFANHSLKGDFTVNCTSSENYAVTLRLVQQCDIGGAPLDDPMVCTIYSGDMAPYTFVMNLDVSLTSGPISTTSVLDNCNDDSGLCLEYGTYEFPLVLPISTESYHLVYQRCCTSPGLQNPVDSIFGFTATFELTPEAQLVCNSNPVLSKNAVFEVCKSEPFSFNLTALDPDGDVLLYEWCAPLLGGGIIGTSTTPGDPTGCDGVTPNPACPPPFEMLNFLPGYSAEQPLGSASSIQLNPNTGDLVGVAMTLGRYITGLCVSEFRDNELLSRQQMNVFFEVVEITAVKEPEVRKLSLYPNPASKEFLIILPAGAGEYELWVRDITGRLLKHQKGFQGNGEPLQLRLEVSDWNSGIYLLEVSKGNFLHFAKVMVP